MGSLFIGHKKVFTTISKQYWFLEMLFLIYIYIITIYVNIRCKLRDSILW